MELITIRNFETFINKYRLNLLDKCRLCGIAGKSLTNVFAEVTIATKHLNNLAELINDCVRVDVKENDELTKKICANCMEKLYSWQDFYKKCQQTQELLQNDLVSIQQLPVKEQESEQILENKDDCLVVSKLPDSLEKENNVQTKKNVRKKSNDFSNMIKETNEVKISSEQDDTTIQFNDTDNDSNNCPKPDIISFHVSDNQGIPCSVVNNDNLPKENLVLKECTLVSHSDRSLLMTGIDENLISSTENISDLSNQENKQSNETFATVLDNCELFSQQTEETPELSNSQENIPPHKNSPENLYKNTQSENEAIISKSEVAKQKSKVIYHCQICNKDIPQKYNYDRHLARHLNASEYKCEKCSKVLSNKCSLRYHMMTHSDKRNYCCHVCGQLFRSASSLCNHLHLHSDVKRFVCPQCGKAFHQSYHLQVHLRSHTGERPYKCAECSRSFSSRCKLNAHVKAVHRGIKSLKCNICGKGFQCNTNYKAHMLGHLGLRNMKCEICDKSFLTKNSLFRHNRLHTGEKPFQCDVCGKRFADCSNRKRHMIQHQEPKPKPRSRKKSSKQPENVTSVPATTKTKKEVKSYTSLRSFLESPEVAATLSSGNPVDEGHNSTYVELVTFLAMDDVGKEVQEAFLVSKAPELTDYELLLKDSATLHSLENVTEDINIQQQNSEDTVSAFEPVDDVSDGLDVFLARKSDVLSQNILHASPSSLTGDGSGNSLEETINGSDNLLDAFLSSDSREQPHEIDMNIFENNSDSFNASTTESQNVIEVFLAPDAADIDLCTTFSQADIANFVTKNDSVLCTP